MKARSCDIFVGVGVDDTAVFVFAQTFFIDGKSEITDLGLEEFTFIDI